MDEHCRMDLALASKAIVEALALCESPLFQTVRGSKQQHCAAYLGKVLYNSLALRPHPHNALYL